ncbi:hypothetical protein BDQ12DRAFT_205451 [Crucibulum laeve]|uniref:Flavin reductase like domain-containing protein n=1 Tax=Crucibulum laeve TaxID=68775 RepID=A0A5C3LXL7_9AGAR|nr:hypothetical protein BDQ12DRAFT_205451 [Crucibulum laeve]
MSDHPAYTHTVSFKETKSPNPDWTYGQGVDTTEEGRKWLEGLQGGFKTIDTSVEDPRKVYGLMLSGIIPRPVAFVSSVSEDGVENLSPYSFFNMVTPEPAMISISVAVKEGAVPKDTARNIKATKNFTVNIISEPWVEQANMTCIDAPPDIGEWALSGLTKEKSTLVKAPRVLESAFSMECELYQAIDILHPVTGKTNNTLILGLVKYIHVRNDVLNGRGVADPGRLKPVARIGGISYAKISEGYQLGRELWEQTGEDIQKAVGDKSKI